MPTRLVNCVPVRSVSPVGMFPCLRQGAWQDRFPLLQLRVFGFPSERHHRIQRRREQCGSRLPAHPVNRLETGACGLCLREFSSEHRRLRIRAFGGAAVPSDHLSAITKRIVTRSCGSVPTITGELGSSAAQAFVMSPGEKNMACGCQHLTPSFKYCCFDIMYAIAPGSSAGNPSYPVPSRLRARFQPSIFLPAQAWSSSDRWAQNSSRLAR